MPGWRAQEHLVDAKNEDLRGTFSLKMKLKVDLLPLRYAVAPLIGQDPVHLKAVLALERAAQVPAKKYAKKFFRIRLGNGQNGGTVSVVN